MNINLNQALSARNPASAANNLTQASGNSSGEQRDMFMTLLVTQLKNQDPLAPQDGAQFVAQLAQFNSLDQLTQIRQSIERLVAMTQHNPASAPASAASII